MTPNWNRFKNIVNKMITADLGNESVTITTPSEVVYNFESGEEELVSSTKQIKTALIPTNKDDFKDLPDGLRDMVTKKIFTTEPIPRYANIVSDFNNEQYEVIVPSVAYTAGGMVHCYRTFLGLIENISKPIVEE